MLLETWKEKHDDGKLQANLQRDLARIMLSLASIPLERIGMFRLNNNGYIYLDNRPLNVQWTINSRLAFMSTAWLAVANAEMVSDKAFNDVAVLL